MKMNPEVKGLITKYDHHNEIMTNIKECLKASDW